MKRKLLFVAILFTVIFLFKAGVTLADTCEFCNDTAYPTRVNNPPAIQLNYGTDSKYKSACSNDSRVLIDYKNPNTCSFDPATQKCDGKAGCIALNDKSTSACTTGGKSCATTKDCNKDSICSNFYCMIGQTPYQTISTNTDTNGNSCKYSSAVPSTPANAVPNDAASVKSCPVCDDGYVWTKNNVCAKSSDPEAETRPPKERLIDKCDKTTGVCLAGCGCSVGDCPGNTKPWENLCQGGKCSTALGTISTQPMGIIRSIFGLVLGVSGGIAIILIILSGYRMLASQGNPEAIKEGREQLTAAIIGLLFIIFSLVILQIIGYDILRIPGIYPGISNVSCLPGKPC